MSKDNFQPPAIQRCTVTYLPTYQPTYLPLNTVLYSHRPVVKRHYSCWGSFDCPHEWYLYSLPLPAEKGEMASSPAVSVQLPSPLITTSSHTSSLHVILARRPCTGREAFRTVFKGEIVIQYIHGTCHKWTLKKNRRAQAYKWQKGQVPLMD